MTDQSFVRTEMLPELDPPASTVGIVGWMRENLFSTWANGILTILSLIFVWYVVSGLLGWAISPTWNGTSLGNCREILAAAGREGHNAGACWGVINERWIQLIFGFLSLGEMGMIEKFPFLYKVSINFSLF